MSIPPLLADQLRADPRIATAKSLLRAALQEHSQGLTSVRPPREDRSVEYASLIESFSAARGGKLFYDFLGSGFGRGPLVELADGSVKYDMITGIGVHPWGHSSLELLDALVDAAVSDTVMQGNLQQNRDSQQFTAVLLELANRHAHRFPHAFLTTSGAMANENALKLLFAQRPGATRVLAFEHAFAGRTLALSAITDKAAYRPGLPQVLPVDYIPYYDAADPGKSLSRTLSALQSHCARYPGAHAGMVLELIQGEGGYNVAPREFLLALCQALREAKVPIWFDEIQTFGRTSQPFAFQHFQLDEFADVVTVGKMTQVCATLFTSALRPPAGLISQTFTGATSSLHAGLAILSRLRDGDFFAASSGGQGGRIQAVHARFVQHFERLHARWPSRITGPWGLGGMVACTVLGGDANATRSFLLKLFDRGVIAFSAGAEPTRVRMLPPFGVLRDEEIDEVCSIIEQCLEEAL